jgi:Na+-driven multidrug efflux pump
MGNDGLWLAFMAFMALRGITLSLRLKSILRDIPSMPKVMDIGRRDF